VWNAIRLCIQKDFLPKDIKSCLDNQPDNFDDFDTFILYKLNEFLDDFKNIKNYEEYITFFNDFKSSIEDIFFSRYIETIKNKPTENTQFVCAYFFNFLLNILYPLVPEFTEALEYVSKKDFVNPIKHIDLNKTINYNTNLLYDTFLKIKQLKIENNIKQHETCNIFIKSTPTICNIFSENKQIFKNYFHISEFSYIRLHEQNPL
jgi:valyl-tRNA synthetase